ncbi:hypothetical protein FD754_022855, partial [Muntiacus muntjak]
TDLTSFGPSIGNSWNILQKKMDFVISLSEYTRSGFLSVYAQQWYCWVIWQFYFQFFKKSLHCSP